MEKVVSIAGLMILSVPMIVPTFLLAYVAWQVVPTRFQSTVVDMTGTRSVGRVWWLATAITIVWLTVYGVSRMSGGTPGPTIWARSGHHHGPWDETNAMFLLEGSFLVLFGALPLQAIYFALRALNRGNKGGSLRAAAVGVFAVACGVLLAYTMYWTVD